MNSASYCPSEFSIDSNGRSHIHVPGLPRLLQSRGDKFRARLIQNGSRLELRQHLQCLDENHTVVQHRAQTNLSSIAEMRNLARSLRVSSPQSVSTQLQSDTKEADTSSHTDGAFNTFLTAMESFSSPRSKRTSSTSADNYSDDEFESDYSSSFEDDTSQSSHDSAIQRASALPPVSPLLSARSHEPSTLTEINSKRTHPRGPSQLSSSSSCAGPSREDCNQAVMRACQQVSFINHDDMIQLAVVVQSRLRKTSTKPWMRLVDAVLCTVVCVRCVSVTKVNAVHAFEQVACLCSWQVNWEGILHELRTEDCILQLMTIDVSAVSVHSAAQVLHLLQDCKPDEKLKLLEASHLHIFCYF